MLEDPRQAGQEVVQGWRRQRLAAVAAPFLQARQAAVFEAARSWCQDRVEQERLGERLLDLVQRSGDWQLVAVPAVWQRQPSQLPGRQLQQQALQSLGEWPLILLKDMVDEEEMSRLNPVTALQWRDYLIARTANPRCAELIRLPTPRSPGKYASPWLQLVYWVGLVDAKTVLPLPGRSKLPTGVGHLHLYPPVLLAEALSAGRSRYRTLEAAAIAGRLQRWIRQGQSPSLVVLANSHHPECIWVIPAPYSRDEPSLPEYSLLLDERDDAEALLAAILQQCSGPVARAVALVQLDELGRIKRLPYPDKR